MNPFYFINRAFYCLEFDRGSSSIDMNEVIRARRKAHRGKMYRRYRHQLTRNMKARVRQ
jgi:hypothetical protein